jgi:ABC-type phosphate/phosphonate transport system substrate-binding protein
VALGVLSGDFDGGAMIGDIFQQYEKRGLRKLADTPEIPEHVLLAGRRISVKDVSALHEALYGLKNTKEGLAVIRAIRDDATGIVPADDKDYDMLRVIMRQLAKLGVK